MQRSARDFAIAVGTLSLAACTGGPGGPDSDTPVPASEPRAEVGLVVDLPHVQGCEERFDLELYRDRAIDLVTWDEHRDACSQRGLTIRYFPKDKREERVLEAVKRLALGVERKSAVAK